MSLKIAAWNIEGRLGLIARHGRGSPERIIDALLALDADVIFLPEAYGARTARGVNDRLKYAGYSWYDAQYHDAGKPMQPSDSNPHSRFLCRLPVRHHTEARYANIRTMQTIIVCDPITAKEVRIMGIHLDDRSEKLRLAQVEDVAEYVSLDQRPTVLMGDFNAMYPVGIAKGLRSGLFKMMARGILFSRLRSLVLRLSDMATGTTLERLCASARLREADLRHQPTMTLKTRGFLWLPSIRIVQLDHILYSREVQLNDFVVAGDGGADHRAITATIEVT
jgi:endonuclease/exonuclease/phosphatase family metal-dependent hydrolase